MANGVTPSPARGTPLWLRIGLAVVLAYVIATVISGAMLLDRLQTRADADRRARVTADLAVLAPLVSRALSTGDRAALDDVASAVRADSDMRMTVILPDGEVIAESHRPLPLSNHADRPEVRQALQDGSGSSIRHSTTVGEPFLYVAQASTAPDGTPVGVLRLSVATAQHDQLTSELFVGVLLAFLAGLPVAALVAWLAARRIAAPLEEMTEAATQMADGKFDVLPHARRDDEAGRLAAALRRMGQEISRMLEASEADRAELSAILGSTVEGVLALDLHERVIRANRGTVEVLHLRELPVPGTPLASVVRLPELSDQIRAALDGEHIRDVDMDLPGTSARVLSISAAPIRAADQAVLGAVVVLRDVTALRHLERARLDFVANVSHELRTPVAAVMGALETVQELEEGETESAERMIDLAWRNAERLSAIVNDLLALSAIEAEAAQLERSPVPVLRSIRSAVAALATEVERRGVRVTLLTSEADTVLVAGHEGRLELVWTNLIGNAVKYSPEGGEVRVRVGSDGAVARIAVEDDGAGIPSECLPRIFERFYRVDKARSRERGGTGLGLAIVKHIVRAHRGEVHVDSEIGSGSTFTVELPLAPTT